MTRRRFFVILSVVFVLLLGASFIFLDRNWLALGLWKARGEKPLQMLDLKDPFDRSVLLAALNNPSESHDAVQLLGPLGRDGWEQDERILESVDRCLDHKDSIIRAMAYSAAIRTRNTAFRKALLERGSKDSDGLVRRYLFIHPEALEAKGLWPLVERAVRADPDPDVRLGATYGLLALGWDAVRNVVEDFDALPTEVRTVLVAELDVVDGLSPIVFRDLLYRIARDDPDASIRFMALVRGQEMEPELRGKFNDLVEKLPPEERKRLEEGPIHGARPPK